ncbi:MAG: VWA domain-containing protein [Gammaproteobacteria bacterium]|nr:VWA domain-containing protein [Gammaproteobacteria bacterium]
MFTVFAIAISLLLVLYWLRYRVRSNPAVTPTVFILLPLMLVLLVYVDRSGAESAGPGAPIVIAIAADVSLSMGTLPAPAANEDVGTRLDRARQTLLPLLAGLGATARPVMISVTAFTAKSETILAWDDDLSLVREIIEYVITTGLLTEAGSDLGTALHGVVPLYESLPEDYRGPEHAKILILVSDGEQTASHANSAIAIAKLRELGVKIISLHVGLPDVPEGLPVYDEDGEFIGFEEVGGQTFSLPDPDLMGAIAGDDPTLGLFVRAESNDAATAIMNFIGLQADTSAGGRLRVGAILVLWGLLLAGLQRWV